MRVESIHLGPPLQQSIDGFFSSSCSSFELCFFLFVSGFLRLFSILSTRVLYEFEKERGYFFRVLEFSIATFGVRTEEFLG